MTRIFSGIMKKIIILFLAISSTAFSQKKLDKLLQKWNKNNVPYMSVETLAMPKTKAILLDARETKEYEVSHIPGARYIGFDDFDESAVSDIDKDKRIVVYCSIGYRSEKIGEKLKKLGYSNSYNLFGSIFEWVNAGQPLEDKEGRKTNKIHTYNKKWSKCVTEGMAEKVW